MKSVKYLPLIIFIILYDSLSTQCIEKQIENKNNKIVAILVENIIDRSNSKITKKYEIKRLNLLVLFSKYNWNNYDKTLPAKYKITLKFENGDKVIYWIGTISDFNELSSNKMSSGYWLAASKNDNSIDSSRYKIFATSVDMFYISTLIQ